MVVGRGQGERAVGPKPTMRDVLKTNDVVLLNFAEAVLADAGVEAVIFDGHMSVMDGSLGILPRRLMVADEDFARARRVLSDSLPDQVPES